MSDELETPILLTFGKYQGKCVEDVPASYLLWLYEQPWLDQHPDLLYYIDGNLEDISEDAAHEECVDPYCFDNEWKND